MSRVLVVSHEASRTGAPRIAVHLAAAFVEAGHDTQVIVRWPGPLLPEFAATGATVHLEPLRRLRVALRRFQRTRSLAVAVETFAARRVLRKIRPDIVWLNTALSACYAKPGLEAGVAVVLHAHESEPLLGTVLARYSLERSWRDLTLVGCSSAVAKELARLSGRADENVTVLASSVDPEALLQAEAPTEPPSSRLRVGGCGRAGVGKGYEEFLSLAEALAGDDVEFLWIGDVDTEVGRRERARSAVLVAGTHLDLPGEVEAPAHLLATLDVFVHPATNDSFPLVVLEAMALGRTVVASALDGIREQVDDAGVLVPPGDVEALRAAVERLLADRDLRHDLGEKAVQRVTERFSVATMKESAVEIAMAAQSGLGNTSASPAERPTNDG